MREKKKVGVITRCDDTYQTYCKIFQNKVDTWSVLIRINFNEKNYHLLLKIHKDMPKLNLFIKATWNHYKCTPQTHYCYIVGIHGHEYDVPISSVGL